MKEKIGKNMWLLPLYFVAGILPFVVYGKHLISPFETESWGYETLSGLDLYGYYKGVTFAILLCFFLFTGIFELMERRKKERLPFKEYLERIRIYSPLIVFVAGVVISSVISGRWDISMVMADSTYETLWLVLLYVCFLIYASSAAGKVGEVQRVFCVLGIGAFLFSVFGFLELLGFAPLTWEWLQRILVRPEDFHLTEVLYFLFPGRITGTLFNPDYAGQYLIIVFPIACSLAALAEQKKYRRFWIVASISILVAAFLTGYRGVVLALGGMILVFGLLLLRRRFLAKKKLSKFFAWRIIGVLCLSIVLLADVLLNKGIFSGVTDFENEAYFEELYIEDDGIVAVTKESGIKIYPTEPMRIVDMETGEDITYRYDDMEGELDYPGFEDFVLIDRKEDGEAGTIEERLRQRELRERERRNKNSGEKNSEEESMEEEQREICLITYGVYWNFEIEEGKIYYLNRALKRDSLEEVTGVFPKAWDTLGAGRLYTWSRTLPLLKNCMLYGYGENSFATIFPQSDYLQKTRVFGTNAMIVDHAHNLFLTIWLYYGLTALLAVLWLLATYIKRVSGQLLNGKDKRMLYLQTGCFLAVTAYVITACFNDSTIFVTPCFLLIFALSVTLLSIKNEDGE